MKRDHPIMSYPSLILRLCASVLLLSACDDERAEREVDASLPDGGAALDQALGGAGAQARALDQGAAGLMAGLMAGADGGADGGAGGAGPEVIDWAPNSERAGERWVRVSLDGAPLSGALITQGGSGRTWRTDEQGLAYVEIDAEALDALTLFASSELARTRSVQFDPSERSPLEIALQRAGRPDQTNYDFSDPGEPRRRPDTGQCGHCHQSNNDAWFASPHRRAASNPTVYDLYMGRASGLRTEAACEAQGGRWALAQQEGRDDEAWQCFQDISALGAFNESCEQPPCDTRALEAEGEARWGGCADCHAPAINGVESGGQDLLSARGHAFDYGVSCDLCHHVDEVDWSAPAGVAGRLRLWRPQEAGPITLGAGGYLPLSFGPSADVSNPRMGISPRPHFRSGELCGGCHQHNHSAEEAHDPVDPSRWPRGELPNQSTYAEWLEGPVSEVSACNGCHMPPLSYAMNSANLERYVFADVGVQGGWPRPYGATRRHSWWGPRQPEAGMLRLAAGLSVSVSPIELEEALSDSGLGASEERLTLLSARGERLWRVSARSSNIGAGHGLPTGEPMRHLMALVSLSCGEEPATPLGGDVIHALGGQLAKVAWAPLEELRVPGVSVGDRLIVTRETGEHISYEGYGPFGSIAEPNPSLPEGARWVGRLLAPEERGLRRELIVGMWRVTNLSPEGELSLSDLSDLSDEPVELGGRLGDSVIVQRGSSTAAPDLAGSPGFSFARVTQSAAGQEMVPHFIATDLIRDNRLAPDQAWESQHLFSASCEAPTASASLIYRAYPLWLAAERGWTLNDEVIASAVVSSDAPRALEVAEPSYPEPTLGADRLTLPERSAPSAERGRALLEALSARGLDVKAELEGDPLWLEPAPTLWLEPQEELSITLSHDAQAMSPLLLSQSAWAQSEPSSWIAPGEQVDLTLSPRQRGVGSYELRSGPTLWRGALVSLPRALSSLSELYQLSLGRAEARAATRRAQAWPWRLETGSLSPRPLIRDPREAPLTFTPPTLDLGAPQLLVNQSSLPIALALPEGVVAWGGELIPATLTEPTPRVEQREAPQEQALLIGPGLGVTLWARASLSPQELWTLGFTPHGGRSWDPSASVARLESSPERRAALRSALGLEAPIEPSEDDSALLSALIELLGQPTEELNASLSALTALPPYTPLSALSERLNQLLQSELPQASAQWVYQGDRRQGAWRIGGLRGGALQAGQLLELRNLSAQGQPFAVEGHLHQLVNEEGQRSELRASSWIPSRGRALIIWPTSDSRAWRAGALLNPESLEGLSTSTH